MPANLPPQYHVAYQKYRKARTIEEKISALREMYAVMPKHKGTDKLQAEIKRKIAQLKEELEVQRKRGKGTGFALPKREGAGQVCLVGAPNSGKSSLLKCLTNAEPEIAEYPFTTKLPNIGMMRYEDIQIQIIDLPPFLGDVPWWQREIVRGADLVLFVVDVSREESTGEINESRNYLESRNISLVAKFEDREEEGLEGSSRKMTIFVGNKVDLEGAEDRLKELKKFLGDEWKVIGVSCKYKINLDELKKLIFESLGIIRVYTKEPGKPPDLKDPLILPVGSSVIEAAEKLHKDFARKLKYARIWGSAKFEGQRVPRDYVLQDKDIIEFHI